MLLQRVQFLHMLIQSCYHWQSSSMIIYRLRSLHQNRPSQSGFALRRRKVGFVIGVKDRSGFTVDGIRGDSEQECESNKKLHEIVYISLEFYLNIQYMGTKFLTL